jgi:hypothetical protein
MKRLALIAAVLAVAACGKKNEATTDTTSTMAPAPTTMSPTPADTGMKMDTTMPDTTMVDTSKKM